MGRCSSCHRAFCTTHRVIGYVDFCVACAVDRQAAATATALEAEQREREAEARVADAVTALIAKASPPAEQLMYPNIERRRLRGYQTIQRPSRYSGWHVGPFAWRWYGRSHQRDSSSWHEVRWPTAVTTDGKVVGLQTWSGSSYGNEQGAWQEAGAQSFDDSQDLVDRTQTLDAVAARLRALAADG